MVLNVVGVGPSLSLGVDRWGKVCWLKFVGTAVDAAVNCAVIPFVRVELVATVVVDFVICEAVIVAVIVDVIVGDNDVVVAAVVVVVFV